MFWKKTDKPRMREKEYASQLQKLYADRRLPNPNSPDFSELTASELAIAERCKFLQQYLNIRLYNLWTVELTDNQYGTLKTYDRPDKAMRYKVWHGDCQVARIEVKLDGCGWEECNHVEIVASLDWAGCFNAHQVKHFFWAIASVHENIFSFENEEVLDAQKMIRDAMHDALWDAFANKKTSEMDNMPADFEIEPIEIGFYGDFAQYDTMIKYWQSKDRNIFQLERDMIEKSNLRDW